MFATSRVPIRLCSLAVMSLKVKLDLQYTGVPGLTLGSRIPGLGISRSKHVQVGRCQLRGLTPWHFLRRYTSWASMSSKSPHNEKKEFRNILPLAMQPALIEAGLYTKPMPTYQNPPLTMGAITYAW